VNPVLDPTLRLAIAGTAGLLALTLAFMAYAFVLHVRGLRIEHRRRALERAWQGRLLQAASGDVASGVDEEDDRAPKVAPEDRILFLDLVTDYARAVRGPERDALERTGAPYLEALRPLLDDHDPYRRAYAVDILGELGMDRYDEDILRALDDASGLVAMVAARALARRGEPRDLPRLTRRLDAFENWSAGYLASLLTSFGPDGSPHLRALMEDRAGAGARYRSVAVQALAELNDLDAVPSAVALLPDETDPEVQADLVRLIAKLGQPGDLAVVRPLVDAPQPYLRAATLQAIGSLSDGRTTDHETVSAGLDDPSPWVALQAARALLALGHRAELADLSASGSPRATLAAEVLAGAA